MSKSENDRVFLSYAHEDLDKVKEVYEVMEKRRLNVWFDKQLDISPQKFSKYLKFDIEERKGMVS